MPCWGVGESFNWPCALRVTATVLPPKDRSLGNGIFNSGAAVGAVLTPLIVTPLTTFFGWRTAFIVVGLLGFGWVVLWLVLLGGERRNLFAGRSSPKPAGDDELLPPPPSRLSPLACGTLSSWWVYWASQILISLLAFWIGLPAIWWGIAFLMIGVLVAALLLPQSALQGTDWAESVGEIVRLRRFWVLVLVSISVNVCWHFLVSWLPSYLLKDRELTGLVAPGQPRSRNASRKGDAKYLASGLLTVVPFLAADAGNLGGGVLARMLAGRGLSPTKARLCVIGLCTLLITSGVWVGMVKSDAVVLVLLGLMAFGTAAYMANYFSFAQEVSVKHTGLVVGILGGLGKPVCGGFSCLSPAGLWT